MAAWYRWQGEDLVLQLRLQPKASRSEWCELQGDAYRLRIKAPPVDGKANAALIAFLAKAFGVARRDVTIESGESARLKRVRIVSPRSIPLDLQITRVSI